MQLEILGRATRKADSLNRWLVSKGCPSIATIYEAEGIKYGVMWDIALFQSILETNWFKFTGDVRAAQNNFAGIGATGGGVPGDSFATVTEGVKAQIQNLALRSGRDIPISEIISPYVQKNYQTIKNRNSKYWADLAGTWAADKNYWNKIQLIMAQYDGWARENNEPNSPFVKVTWLELNRTDEGKPAITAWDGSVPRFTRFIQNKAHLIEFLKAFPDANTVLVADTKNKIIPQLPDIGGEEPPIVIPARRLLGESFLCEPGHSVSRSGAHGLGSPATRPDEYAHNLIAAHEISLRLRREGALVDTFDPDPDDLIKLGQRASGKTAALYNHHNAANANGVCEGSEIFVHPLATDDCRRLAAQILSAICAAIGSKNRGVKEAKYTVLSESIKTNCKYNMLIEYYFIDDYAKKEITEAKTRAAAIAVAEVLTAFFGR